MRTAGQHNTTTADAKHSADDFEEDTSDVRVAYECCVPECAALICSCSVPQYSHGVNKGTLAKNVAKVEAKEKELKAAQEKAKVNPWHAEHPTSFLAQRCFHSLTSSFRRLRKQPRKQPRQPRRLRRQPRRKLPPQRRPQRLMRQLLGLLRPLLSLRRRLLLLSKHLALTSTTIIRATSIKYYTTV